MSEPALDDPPPKRERKRRTREVRNILRDKKSITSTGCKVEEREGRKEERKRRRKRGKEARIAGASWPVRIDIPGERKAGKWRKEQ
ncbi:hypothetical protein Tco_0535417 [Tanacetum coccineum]